MLDLKQAIYYLYLASEQNNEDAQLLLAFIYSCRVYNVYDINLAIHYYKESSSLNNQYAKNNLAVIYRIGFDVEKNIYYAIELLKEAILQKNDFVSMYNLAHIYLFEDIQGNNLDTVIELLIKSYPIVVPSKVMLSLAILKKFNEKITLEIIENQIKIYDHTNDFKIRELTNFVYKFISEIYTKDAVNKEFYHYKYHCNGLIYVNQKDYVPFDTFMSFGFNSNSDNNENTICKKINEEFYEGFDIK